MDYRLWKPQDEIAFIKGLTTELPHHANEVRDLKERAMLIVGYGSPQRPATRAQRLDALRMYLAVLPYRHFPGWSQDEQQAVIRQATEIYAKASVPTTEAR